MAFFDEWERTAVYFRVRCSGTAKYVKAPFDFVRIGTEFAVEPMSGAGNNLAAFVNQSFPVELTERDEEFLMCREEGMHNLRVVIIDRNQMGDMSDNWIGVHRFDPI